MARPQKQGLSYFPLDVDIDQDDKVALIEATHGQLGFAVIVKLLMKIYKEGYYYEWTEKEQLLFSKRINVNINEVNVIINDCVKWGLFDKSIFDNYQVLTSGGIQRRFLEANTRRKELQLIEEYLLINTDEIDLPRVNVNINSINVSNNPENVNIKKQTKLNKTKLNKTKLNHNADMVIDDNNIFTVFEVLGFGVLNNHFKDQLEEMEETYSKEWTIDAMKRAVESGHWQLGYVKGILQNWKSKGRDAPKAPSVKQQTDSTKILGFTERQYDMSELEKQLLGRG